MNRRGVELEKLPVIDMRGFADGAFERITGEIAKACRTVGFFYVVDHGVAPDLMRAAFAEARAFFAEPVATKAALAIERVGGNRGYSGLKHEALDPKAGADLKEAFNIGLDLAPDDPELITGIPFRTLNVWPDSPGFKPALLAYFKACSGLANALHRAFASDLGLPLDFFRDKLDRPMATLRMLHYPASSSEGEIGAGEHTDYGNITLLATDDVGGLEVRTRSGDWIAAPPIADAFVVNISTRHRVVNRSGRERYSIAFFFDPNPDALGEAIPSCGAPRYPPILAADYLKMRLDASVPKGM